MAKRLGWYKSEQFLLKITLMRTEPAIWRRVEVHSGLTLDDLHYVIQCVFDWENSHLYEYRVPPMGKLTQKAMREARCYCTWAFDSDFWDDDTDALPADEAIIGNIFSPDCKQIVYEYDMGDSWTHLVKLEKRIAEGDENHIPLCLAGENAAPIDDMGGTWGYYEFLEALEDSNHEMHDIAVEWLGQDFDPTKFDINVANKRLAKVFRPVVKKPRKKAKRKTTKSK